MSLKLCCSLPVTLNCLKSARVLFLASDRTSLTKSSTKLVNYCRNIQHYRCLSTKISDKRQDSHIKEVYFGTLAPQIKAIKLFSLSSSIVGLVAQPWLYNEIVQTANVPVIVAAYSFIGFFTLVTPILLHLITKKYVIELFYNEKTDTYTAKTVNFFCRIKETEFKADDVLVPEVPGMFTTFNVKGKSMFVDPRQFELPDHYSKLMGYNKPMDFKLYGNELKSDSSTSSSSPDK